MNIEPLWELYRKLTREAHEHQKKYDREKKEGLEYASLTYIEMDAIRARSAGVMQSIEALAEDKQEVWRRGFEIWQEENELAPEGKFGCWMPTEKKKQPDSAGFPCLVTAVNPYGQKMVFEAFTGYGEPLNQWYTLNKTHSGEGEKVADCLKITAWMPMPEPYEKGGKDEEVE